MVTRQILSTFLSPANKDIIFHSMPSFGLSFYIPCPTRVILFRCKFQAITTLGFSLGTKLAEISLGEIQMKFINKMAEASRDRKILHLIVWFRQTVLTRSLEQLWLRDLPWLEEKTARAGREDVILWRWRPKWGQGGNQTTLITGWEKNKGIVYTLPCFD